MKAFYRTILAVITGILLQSCTKTYEIQFDKLFLVAIENFKTPIFIENCKMVIKTEDDFNINKYTKNSKDPELLNFISYATDFEDDYNNENASVFYIPDDINKGNIILYDNATNTKYIEISLNKGIKSISVYENGKVVSEAKGDIQTDDIEGFYYYLASGNMKFYDYDSNGKQYVSKEQNFVYQPELEEITQNDYYEDNETAEDYEYKHEEDNNLYEEEYTQNYQNQETEDTSIAPWMIGTWKGSLNYGDMNIFWSLEIDEYGNTTQIIYNPQGGSEVELLHLKYDRISQQLYYKDGGLNITIEVDANNKCLYMPSAYGTLYFKKN